MKKFYALVISLIIISILVLPGCWSKKNPETSKVDILQNGDQPKEQEDKIMTVEDIEKAIGGNIEVNMGRTGNNMSLPSDFPKDVLPLMDDANIVNINDSKNPESINKSIGIIYTTHKSLDETISFYRDVMKNGNIDMDINQGNGYLLGGAKDNYNITISISEYNNGDVGVLLDISPR